MGGVEDWFAEYRACCRVVDEFVVSPQSAMAMILWG